jgi:4-hydroxy-tetrahydrodipicolinate synthase
VVRLSRVKNIVGIKESTSNIERITDLMMRVPEDFLVFSGNDDSALAYVQLGADGVISVTANVRPRLMHEMCVAAKAGDAKAAIAINNRLLRLHRHLFVETNPIPVKVGAQSHGPHRGRHPPAAHAPHAREPRDRRRALRTAGCLT